MSRIGNAPHVQVLHVDNVTAVSAADTEAAIGAFLKQHRNELQSEPGKAQNLLVLLDGVYAAMQGRDAPAGADDAREALARGQ